jgi:DNA-binding CsgD family transcriptional regulator
VTAIDVDTTEWPLVQIRFPEEPVSDSALRRYLSELSEIGRRGRPYATLTDISAIPAPLTASQRLIFDEWMQRNKRQLERVAVGNAIVANTPVSRGTVETAYWNWRDPPTFRLFAREAEARGWCRVRIDRLAQRRRRRRIPTSPPPPKPHATNGLIDLFGEPAFLVSPAGVVVFANRAARDAFPPPRPWLADAVSRGPAHCSMPVRIASVVIDGRSLYLVIVDEGAAFAELPPRLFEIARLIAAGKTDKEIAVETGLASSSVRTYVRRLYERVDVSSRAELVRLWYLRAPSIVP